MRPIFSSDAIQVAPADRTFSPVHDFIKQQTIFGSFLDGSDLFDAALFGIGAEEATQMDPQHRVLLRAGGRRRWHVFCDLCVAFMIHVCSWVFMIHVVFMCVHDSTRFDLTCDYCD
jgi:hypothetical protein